MPDSAPELAPREQILLAAAALFTEQGFGGTSTRAIAEASGIRQASLYYHFAGKDDILAELLDRSVRPSTEMARRLEGAAGDDPGAAAAALHALAEADVTLLAAVPHNIGSLYLLPEVRDQRFDDFRAQRAALQGTYGRLGVRARALAEVGVGGEGEGEAEVEVEVEADRGDVLAAGTAASASSSAALGALPETALGALLIQVVEVVIPLRRNEEPVPDPNPSAIADAVLRLVGLDASQIRAARVRAGELVGAYR